MSDPTDTPDPLAGEPLDAALTALFASARPDPGLEDRLVRSLRAETTPKRKLGWRRYPLAWGVAASVGLGAIGAAVASQLDGGLPLPWEADGRKIARAASDYLGMQVFDTTDSMDAELGMSAKSSGELTALGKRKEAISNGRSELPQLRDGFPDGFITAGADQDGVYSGKMLGGGNDLNSPLRGHDLARSKFGEEGRWKASNGTVTLSLPQPTGGQVAAGTAGLFGSNGSIPDGGATWDRKSSEHAALDQSIKDKMYAAKSTEKGKENTLSLGYGFTPDAHRYREAGGDKDKVTLDDAVRLKQKAESFGVTPSGSAASSDLPANKSAEDTVLLSGKGVTAGVPVTETKARVVRGTTAYSPATSSTVQPAEPVPPAAVGQRKVILRSGDIEFEIESFDSAVATVTKLVTAIDGAFVSTVNSEKLPNGKVKGSVAVRVPPDKLDGLVLDLRRDLGKGGELKGQRIGSQDVTKQYTDLESRLKAARTMETRLLAIIKDGKGEIKQLLDAEKELGLWRTKIEEMEGEKRYFDNLAALSNLTITLAEKEIKAAAGVTESEVVQTGIEVEDVEQAYRDALAAVTAANGRVTKSDLKQVSSGQFNATLNFEIAPDAAGPVRDRLRQLGRVARLEITRVATADAGGTVTKDAKVKRGDTRFEVQLYNVTAMPPRESAGLKVATEDVAKGYRDVRAAVEKAKGRILASTLNETDKANPTAQLDFEVKRTEEAAVQTALGAAGEVVSRQVSRAAESDAVTDTKVLLRVEFVNPHRLAPRESVGLVVEAADVDAAGAVLVNAVKDAGGRVADSGTGTDRGTGKVTARYVVDVPLASAAGIAERAKASGSVKVNQVTRNNAAPEGRYATARLDVTFTTPDRIVAPDDGFGPQLKNGLSKSATALFASLAWLVFGLLVVLPWAVVLYLGYRLLRRLFRSPAK